MLEYISNNDNCYTFFVNDELIYIFDGYEKEEINICLDNIEEIRKNGLEITLITKLGDDILLEFSDEESMEKFLNIIEVE